MSMPNRSRPAPDPRPVRGPGLLPALLRLSARPRLLGLDRLRDPAARILVCNHLSWLDAPLLLAILPHRPVLLLDPATPPPRRIARLLRAVETVSVDPERAGGLSAALDLLRAGRTLLCFPEGRPTTTGTLMLMRPAAALLADAAGLPLQPLHLDGPQRGRFAPLDRSRIRKRPFPRTTLTVHPPVPAGLPAGTDPAARRDAAVRLLRAVMAEAAFAASDTALTLLDAIHRAGREWGMGREAVSDPIRGTLSFRALLAGARAFGERFREFGPSGTPVAMLLPNAGGTLACLLGLSSAGLVPVMLNPRGGPAVFEAARRATGFRVLLTVRPLIQRLNLAADLAALEAAGVRPVFLDDQPLSRVEKLRGLLRGGRPSRPRAPDDPAVILLTSGSSGTPKAAVLSHRAIVANVRQVATMLEFGPRDLLFNALPLFHSFGLSSGTLLPLVAGARVFLHPNPLDYDGVPDWCYRTGATVLFVTQSFAEGYLRRAAPLALSGLRLVVGGASKIRRETIDAWSERFGQRILVGYGLTETAPVVSFNIPASNRFGTAGLVLPGIELRFTPVDGIEGAAALSVRGPNNMLGYLDPSRPGQLLPPPDNWFDTGDVARLDPDGHLVIVDRLSRFAKVGGEKVSLDGLDAAAAALWPGASSLSVAVPDLRRGERIVLLTEHPNATRQDLVPAARAAGLPEIAIPREVLVVPAVPMLSSGKPDFAAARRLAEALLSAPGPVAAEHATPPIPRSPEP